MTILARRLSIKRTIEGGGGFSAPTIDVTLTPVAPVVDLAGTFSPTDIAGLMAWYDFGDPTTLYVDAGTTLVSGDGQAIQQANDKSGTGNHLSQATSGARPLYKTNIQNGRSVARFDGTDDRMTSAAARTQPYTVFVVADDNAAGDKYMVDGAAQNEGLVVASNGTTYRIYAGGSLVDLGSVTTSVFNIIAAKFNGASSLLRAQGASQTGNPGASNTTGTTLGSSGTPAAGTYLNGDIAEVLIYDTALSDANLNLVGNYLERWGLTWTDI